MPNDCRMITLKPIDAGSQPAIAAQHADPGSVPLHAKSIYFALLSERGAGQGQIDELAGAASRVFLGRQLQAAAPLCCDLPGDVRSLAAWSEAATQTVGRRYREYLDARQAGAPRRYFSGKAHALYFLRSAAPTKLVDGAWLYGLLQHWDDARFAPLIRTYLEELGEGIDAQNHVVLYRKLLAAHGCEHWDNLSDDRFTQGAIQLSLAHHAAQFLPEVIGFNLGYERLPLHLLITAYELGELDIDPHYFSLHVTIDNVASGHARKALRGVSDALPRVADAVEFYRRVTNGYKLNLLGVGTESIIESFEPFRELLSLLRAKATVGSQLHSDYGRVDGRTVNDWLSSPDDLPAFLAGLERIGWIKRHQDPRNSRFWRLLHGPRAEMFGVFNGYEQQLIHDWIAGAWNVDTGHPAHDRFGDTLDAQFPADRAAEALDDFNAEQRLLAARLAASPSRQETMALLIGLMSPANHHTAAGLMATRVFTRLLR